MSVFRFATSGASTRTSSVVAWCDVGGDVGLAAMIEDSDGFIGDSENLKGWLLSAMSGAEVEDANRPLGVVQNVYDRVCVEERRRGWGPIGLSVACVSVAEQGAVYCGVGAIRLWYSTKGGDDSWLKSDLLVDMPSSSDALRSHASVITRVAGPISPRPDERVVRHLKCVSRCALVASSVWLPIVEAGGTPEVPFGAGFDVRGRGAASADAIAIEPPC